MTYRNKLSRQLSLIFCFLIILVFVSCSDKVIGPQTAEITPIKNLTLTKTITSIGTMEGFEKTVENGIYVESKVKAAEGLKEAFQRRFRKDHPNYEYTVIWVGIENYDTLEKARAAFDRFAVDAKLKSYGSDDNRNLMSPVIQPRTDFGGGYRLMKSYRSQLVFHKNNLLIYINEDTSDPKLDSMWKDDIIRDMAEALSSIK